MDMSRPPCLALDQLPPELLLRIFTFVAELGTPELLLNLGQTCRTFYSLLIPPNGATDRNIWKPAAWGVLGDHAPETLIHDGSYQAFVRRLVALYTPPVSTSSNATSIDFRPLRHGERLNTSATGTFPLEPRLRLAARAVRGRPPDYPNYYINTSPLPPVLKGTTRTYDFLQTCTEASRPLSGYAYLSVAPFSNFFAFGDDPRNGLARSQFGRGCLESGANHPLRNHIPHPPTASAHPAHVLAYNHQSLHSDPDLLLFPFPDNPTRVAAVKNLANGNRWNITAVPHEFPDYFGGPSPGSITEFRSAGPYLAFCADTGANPSAPPLLSCAKTDGTHWTRTIEPSTTPGTLLENDGLRMTVSTIAFASRRYRPHPNAPMCPHMKFYLFSTATGDLIRTLSFNQESVNLRPDLGWLPDAWCSFALSDTHLIATVGGHSHAPSSARWQYPSLLVWELRRSAHDSPAYAVPLPARWRNNADSYVAFSKTGAEAVVCARWSCAVWDMHRKRPVGVWDVPAGRREYDAVRRDPGHPDARDIDSWWNGMWVGFRDVCNATGKTTARGVGFFVADVFREFFGRYGARAAEDTPSERGDDGIVWVVGRDGVWRSEGKRTEAFFHGYNNLSAMGEELHLRWEEAELEARFKPDLATFDNAELMSDSEGLESDGVESDDEDDLEDFADSDDDESASEASDDSGSEGEADGTDGTSEGWDDTEGSIDADLTWIPPHIPDSWSELLALIGGAEPASGANPDPATTSSDGSEGGESTGGPTETDDPADASAQDSSGSSTIGPTDSLTTASADDSAHSSADGDSEVEWLGTAPAAVPAQPAYILLSDTE